MGLNRLMFGLLRKMKSKIMVVESFFLFFLLHLNSMVEARPFLCSEIDMQNEMNLHYSGTRGSSEWSSIQRPVASVTLQKREEKKQKNMSAQKFMREAQKYGGFLFIEDGRGCIM